MCIEEEKEEEKEVVLSKMHKSLRKLINKSPDKYNDDDEIDDLTASFERTFVEEEVTENEVTEQTETVTRTSSRVKNIEIVRNKALDKLKDQAQTMLNRNKKAINSLNVDDFVLYRADDVDLGAADAPNIVCVILEKNDSMLKLGHKGGVLKE